MSFKQFIIENEAILPDQYFTQARIRQPEQNLQLAVLESAMNDLTYYIRRRSRHTRNLAVEAWEWVQTGDIGLLTFDDVCEHLEFNPETIRKGIQHALNKEGVLPSLRRRNSRHGSEKLYF